jgi:tellurite resistance protein
MTTQNRVKEMEDESQTTERQLQEQIRELKDQLNMAQRVLLIFMQIYLLVNLGIDILIECVCV